MSMKGEERMKFDEFGLIILGAVIFLGILAFGFTTPSEFPPKVAPTSFDLHLDPGQTDSFSFNITGGISEANITVSGEIASWLQPARTDLGALKSKTIIPVTVSVPRTATAGTHAGKVTVNAKEGQADVQVNVIVAPIGRLIGRTLSIGDFNVRYVSGTKTLDSNNKTFVSKSYLYEKAVNLDGEVDESELSALTALKVKFFVTDANDYGPIMVQQNGKTVFSQLVGPGQVVIPLNSSDIRSSNIVTVRADNPGLIFWGENVYGLSDLKLDATFNGGVNEVYNFTLEPEEFKKFDHAQLTFNVNGATDNLPPLKITLNGQTLFFGKPPSTSFNLDFPSDIYGEALKVSDKNTLVFSFSQPASYDVSGATLVVFTRAAS